MVNRNTFYSTKDYIVGTCIVFLASLLYYRLLFFCSLPCLSELESKLVLYIGSVLLLAIGIVLTSQKRRNNSSIAVNVLIPLEAYSCVAYFYLMPGLITWVIFLSLLLGLSFIFLVLLNNRNARFGKRLAHGLLGGMTIVAYTIAVFFISLLIAIAIG